MLSLGAGWGCTERMVGNNALSLSKWYTDKHGYLEKTDCTHCSNRVVEHEFLFLTECNKYNNIGETYLSRTEDICSGFIKIKREEKSLLGEIGEYIDLISLYLLSCHILRENTT